MNITPKGNNQLTRCNWLGSFEAESANIRVVYFGDFMLFYKCLHNTDRVDNVLPYLFRELHRFSKGELQLGRPEVCVLVLITKLLEILSCQYNGGLNNII